VPSGNGSCGTPDPYRDHREVHTLRSHIINSKDQGQVEPKVAPYSLTASSRPSGLRGPDSMAEVRLRTQDDASTVFQRGSSRHTHPACGIQTNQNLCEDAEKLRSLHVGWNLSAMRETIESRPACGSCSYGAMELCSKHTSALGAPAHRNRLLV
jgi:hypothetical protein